MIRREVRVSTKTYQDAVKCGEKEIQTSSRIQKSGKAFPGEVRASAHGQPAVQVEDEVHDVVRAPACVVQAPAPGGPDLPGDGVHAALHPRYKREDFDEERDGDPQATDDSARQLEGLHQIVARAGRRGRDPIKKIRYGGQLAGDAPRQWWEGVSSRLFLN